MRTTTKIATLATIGMLATASSAFAWIDHPSDSDDREYHDIWGMTCYPTNGVPFKVTTSGKTGGSLIIYGAHGQARINDIESVKNIDDGFVVVANGFDYKGKHREIEVGVSKKTSFLAVNRDIDNSIQCSGAIGIEGD
jgi:hypothetical protein